MERVLSSNNEVSKSLEVPSLQKETEGAEDFWILHQRDKEYKIRASAAWLFENLLPWFSGESLPKNREVQLSLYKRTRSRYYYINISYGGKRIRVTSRCENKRDANKVKLLLLTQLIQQQVVSPSNQTLQGMFFSPKPTVPNFAVASGKYLKDMCIGKKAAWKREDLCHRDLLPVFGGQRIDQITPQLVLKWREEETQRIVRGGKKISPRSVNYNLGYLKRFFNYAIEIQGWVKDNPAGHIHPLAENNRRDRILSEDEEQKLLDACEYPWFRRLLIFGIETGLRIGEIASLKIGEFHLDYGIPHFKKARAKNKAITEFPVVSERLVAVVHQQLSVPRTTDYFFTDENRNPVTTDKIERQFKKATTKAGIEGLVLHDLRRTFCSRLNWLGCNKMFTEYLMGHTVKGIEARYLVNNLEGLCEELKRMEVKKTKSRVTHLSHFKKSEEVPVSVQIVETQVAQGV